MRPEAGGSPRPPRARNGATDGAIAAAVAGRSRGRPTASPGSGRPPAGTHPSERRAFCWWSPARSIERSSVSGRGRPRRMLDRAARPGPGRIDPLGGRGAARGARLARTASGEHGRDRRFGRRRGHWPFARTTNRVARLGETARRRTPLGTARLLLVVARSLDREVVGLGSWPAVEEARSGRCCGSDRSGPRSPSRRCRNDGVRPNVVGANEAGRGARSDRRSPAVRDGVAVLWFDLLPERGRRCPNRDAGSFRRVRCGPRGRSVARRGPLAVQPIGGPSAARANAGPSCPRQRRLPLRSWPPRGAVPTVRDRCGGGP
ncbi:MAG: hypothetical protein KatS3mg117_1596 [Geminicoccaceae bacterium]|nr:MAG: hypothetical protein KatS3mg117_1596 [Geminicoccaceae bacterium]